MLLKGTSSSVLIRLMSSSDMSSSRSSSCFLCSSCCVSLLLLVKLLQSRAARDSPAWQRHDIEDDCRLCLALFSDVEESR